ncbi:hypothetical protein WR25_16058 [Diploscapter pachys]|uniref:PWWP domain-containing protein n=1 Tax=Diploscapter pachys TaxID=2018661 RepID=A0A2A2KJ54_9BILA|nr:hypothetical protein WR25_16058 [Diploscapter pachys]
MAATSSGRKPRTSSSMAERLNHVYSDGMVATVRFVDDEEAESKVAAEITLISVTLRHPLTNKELFDVIQRAPTPAPYSSPTKSEPKHEVTVSEPRSSNSSQSNESSPSPVPERSPSPRTALEPGSTAPVLEVEIETSSSPALDVLATPNLEPTPEPETVMAFEDEGDEELLEQAPVLEPERATITPVSHSGASQNGSIMTEDGIYQSGKEDVHPHKAATIAGRPEHEGRRKPGRKPKGQRSSRSSTGPSLNVRKIKSPGKIDFDEFQLKEAKEWQSEWISAQLRVIDSHRCYTSEMKGIVTSDKRCPMQAYRLYRNIVQYEKVLSYLDRLEGEPDIQSLPQPPWTCVTHSDNSKEITKIPPKSNPKGFFIGDYVWACYRAKEFWPAIIVNMTQLNENDKVTVEVNWIESNKYSRGYVNLDQIDPFDYGFAYRFDEKKTDKRYLSCVGTALSEFISHTRKNGFFERFLNPKLYAFLQENFIWTVDSIWPYRVAILNGKIQETKFPDPAHVCLYDQLEKRSSKALFLDQNNSMNETQTGGEPKHKKRRYSNKVLNKVVAASQEKDAFRMSVNMCIYGTSIVRAENLLEKIEDFLCLPEQDKRIYEIFLRRMNVLACCGSNELNEAEDGGSSANPNYLFLSPEKLHVASNPDPLNEPHLVTNGEAVMSESKASPPWDDVFGLTSTTKRKNSGDSTSTTKKDSEGVRTIKVEEYSNGNEASTSSTGQHMEMIIHNIKKEEEDENTIIAYKEAANMPPRYIMHSPPKPSTSHQTHRYNGHRSAHLTGHHHHRSYSAGDYDEDYHPPSHKYGNPHQRHRSTNGLSEPSSSNDSNPGSGRRRKKAKEPGQ